MSADSSQIVAGKPCLPPFKKQEEFVFEQLLPRVSRSFYLTLRILPREIRQQISLAYLLARASDTIADCFSIARAERLVTLNRLQEAFLSGRILPGMKPDDKYVHLIEPIESLRNAQISESERRLLDNLDVCLDVLTKLPEGDQKLIRTLLVTIVGGQIFDLEKFAGEDKRDLTALGADEDLDRYTYMVAGCVGEFWTKMCVAHLKALGDWDLDKTCKLGVRFGKGLQLVNVLRDVAWDLRRGRCYLPVEQPRMLLDPGNFESVHAEYNRWLDRAVEHLDAGWEYTMQIPPSLWRLRLACIWPIWIGLKTIARLRTGNPLDPAGRIKISRGEVYGVMARSFLVVRSDAALNRAFQKLRDAASRR